MTTMGKTHMWAVAGALGREGRTHTRRIPRERCLADGVRLVSGGRWRGWLSHPVRACAAGRSRPEGVANGLAAGAWEFQEGGRHTH